MEYHEGWETSEDREKGQYSRYFHSCAQQMLSEWMVLILKLKLVVNFKVVLDE